ncbi:helix-turn-helix domain-containing protein [Leptospira adleri]|uniref:AraC family transcriptional regulator n=1 Tax=Leptospira adleri TaxID=2023186 RepID=A0A2M9YJX3_9LEPT|nr:helix-turn-helix domain-containing protein [Leptospira adleri]PJZ51833.1 AraC family transcriptional regulator [Leptospira adleri]PJZ62323.1 AraC family transcriptional regulator [Leptospira adleri]
MNIKTYHPNGLLRSYIRDYMIIESGVERENRILPNSSAVLSFRMEGDVRITENSKENLVPVLGIAGLRKNFRLIRYSKKASMLLVNFKEGGASEFFPIPMNEIFGINLSLDQILPKSRIALIEEKLFETKTNEGKIGILEKFLLSQIRGTNADLLVMETVRRIRNTNGNLKITEILQGMPISRDSYEKRFRKTIGTSPKQFANLIRIKSLIERYSSFQTLTDLSHDAGYFDQAHFIKDFRSFTGQTPKDFFKAPAFW